MVEGTAWQRDGREISYVLRTDFWAVCLTVGGCWAVVGNEMGKVVGVCVRSVIIMVDHPPSAFFSSFWETHLKSIV